MIGQTKLKRSKHLPNADANRFRKKKEHEIRSNSIAKSSRDRLKHDKISNHHSHTKTHKRRTSSNQSCWSEDSEIDYQPNSCDSSIKFKKHSDNFKLKRESSQNHNSRSSTPLSHSSSRKNDFKSKSTKTKSSRCNVTPIIGSNEDKWNDFDEMIRRIKTNLSSENCFEHDFPKDDDELSKVTTENICGSSEYTQGYNLNDRQTEKDISSKGPDKENHLDENRQSFQLLSPMNLSDDNSDKELHLRMSDDDIEEDANKMTDQALNGIVFAHPGNL